MQEVVGVLYVLAIAAVGVIAFLLWRAMSGGDPAEVLRGQRPVAPPSRPRRSRPTGPDDDPDFLRSLDDDLRRGDDPPA